MNLQELVKWIDDCVKLPDGGLFESQKSHIEHKIQEYADRRTAAVLQQKMEELEQIVNYYDYSGVSGDTLSLRVRNFADQYTNPFRKVDLSPKPEQEDK